MIFAEFPINQERADAEQAQAYNTSPEGKAAAAKELNGANFSSRMTQLKDPSSPVSKVSRADQAYWVANGKLPDPDRYHAPAEEVLFNRAYNAEAAQHPKGWKPTLDDIRGIAEAAKGADPEAIADARSESTRVRAAAAQLVAATRRLTSATKAATDNLDPQKQASIDAEVQGAEREYEQAQSAMAQPAPAAPAPAQPSPQPANSGPTVAVSPGASHVMPPASLLNKTPENGVVRGRGGEVYKKVKGKWAPQ